MRASLHRGHARGRGRQRRRRGVQRLELREEAVALAVLAPGAGVLGAPVVLVHVLELLLALLGAPVVTQPCKLPCDVLPERRFERGAPEVGVHLRPDPDERQRLLARPPVAGRSRAAGAQVGLHVFVLESDRHTGAGAARCQFLEISARPRRLQLHRRQGWDGGGDRHGEPRRRRRERGRARARASRLRGHVRGPGATVVVQHGRRHLWFRPLWTTGYDGNWQRGGCAARGRRKKGQW
uniref:Uncharacterized protein n=1 Tax=Zea mays TaxID=4577 RepID=C4J6N9_MAIZE|nr:unknown [Zea mays]